MMNDSGMIRRFFVFQLPAPSTYDRSGTWREARIDTGAKVLFTLVEHSQGT